jgi:hypothetical protein
MFIVKKKKEYNKIWYQMVFLSVAMTLFGLVACIYAIPKLLIEDEMGGVIFLILSCIALFGFALGVYLPREKIKKTVYQFEKGKFKSIYKNEERVIDKKEITECKFYPQCTVEKGYYSDAIVFFINDDKDHPIDIYLDYDENFDKVREWLFDENIEVKVWDNYMGENHPSYRRFMDRSVKYE